MIISPNDIENSITQPDMAQSPSKLKYRLRPNSRSTDIAALCLVTTVFIVAIDLLTGSYKDKTVFVLKTVVDNSVLKSIARGLLLLSLLIIVAGASISLFHKLNNRK